MRLTLEKKWTERLVNLPESGMGYQRVLVRLKDGRMLENVVVLNGQVLEVPDAVREFTSRDILAIEPAARLGGGTAAR
ncbi:MAG: hypothetical protein ACREMW_11280 [Gemmatimonadales bacterium]